jgi:hypothetical protein
VVVVVVVVTFLALLALIAKKNTTIAITIMKMTTATNAIHTQALSRIAIMLFSTPLTTITDWMNIDQS